MTSTAPPLTRLPCGTESGLFSLADLDTDTVRRLGHRSTELFRDVDAHDAPLRGRTVGILFTKTSTRTRTAFTVGTVRLGGFPITYGPADLQTNTGESLQDTGRILGAMLDVLVARTAGPVADLRELSRHGRFPVVNALATEEHPTQGLCDLATLQLHFGRLDGLHLLYVGEGNNTAAALAFALAHVPGAMVTFATPPGFGLPDRVLAEAAARAQEAGSAIVEVHSMADLPARVDVVYTSRWQTTGTSKSDASWREKFRAFHVDETLMRQWPRAWFMHDLPAQRGDEVAGDVLDGPMSLVWTQARMKLMSAMAVLEWIASGMEVAR